MKKFISIWTSNLWAFDFMSRTNIILKAVRFSHVYLWPVCLIATHLNNKEWTDKWRTECISIWVRRLWAPWTESLPLDSCRRTQSLWWWHSSTSPAPHQPRPARPGWSTPSQSWKWCPAKNKIYEGFFIDTENLI